MLDIATAGKNNNGGEAGASAKREALEEELAELESRLSVEFLVDSSGDSSASKALEDATDRMAEIYDLLEELDTREKNDPSDDECNSNDNNNNNNHHHGDNPFAGLEDRAVTILRGLQFTGLTLDVPVTELSGGWRMGVALAEGAVLRTGHPPPRRTDESPRRFRDRVPRRLPP